MVDEFEYNALLMEMHLLRVMNRSLQSQMKMMRSRANHPTQKEAPRNED
jgi:hypothetical protein